MALTQAPHSHHVKELLGLLSRELSGPDGHASNIIIQL